MSTFTPYFPPLILEKCLDLARDITEKQNGKAAFELNLGNSRFKFSIDNSLNTKTGFPSRGSKSKNKSPSDRRRDALRRQKFLEKKRISSPPSAVSSSDSSSADAAQVPVIKTPSTPPTMVSEEKEVMDTAEEEENVPSENATRNDSDQEITDDDFEPISPQNTPQKNLEEIHLLFCAQNKLEATNLSKAYPQMTFVCQVPNNKYHFYFSMSVLNLQNLKEATFKNEIKWEDNNVLAIDLCSERRTIYPKIKKHCQDCQKRHRK